MKLSIIIPTYNSSEFLQRCLSSVRDQSLKEFEVIVVDNYSNDNTEEIVNNFRDLSIKFIKSENIGNVAQSRNEGIKNSKFDYKHMKTKIEIVKYDSKCISCSLSNFVFARNIQRAEASTKL